MKSFAHLHEGKNPSEANHLLLHQYNGRRNRRRDSQRGKNSRGHFPDDGARTGCTVLCIQSIVKLLEASGQTVKPGETHQCYGKTFTLWDLDASLKKKYEGTGYHFDEDIEMIEKVFEKDSER